MLGVSLSFLLDLMSLSLLLTCCTESSSGGSVTLTRPETGNSTADISAPWGSSTIDMAGSLPLVSGGMTLQLKLEFVIKLIFF